MTVADSMESYAARLATFNVAHPTTKKRTSDARGKTLKWPHKNPPPPKLARAGFLYQPTSSCPDNTTCYLCQSNLDGWEEDDNAVEEHLKHAPDCGWAITAALEQNIEDGSHDLEDPTSEKMQNARQMTFDSKWPHENKRGWTCKTQKMVDAGWHYCPTLDSDDFVKCSYCSLSLDGWEPKDNPYDEHQRRSPDCIFFTFFGAKSKPSRANKGRASTTSRLSTQSSFTAITEGISIAETEANQDESTIHTLDMVKPTKARKGGKKASKAKKASSKAKGKTAKAKQEESKRASSFVEPEDDDFEVKVAQVPVPIAKSKKRKSEEMRKAEEDIAQSRAHFQNERSLSPPRKRRATRASSSVVPLQEVPISTSHAEMKVDTHMIDVDEMPPLSDPVSKKLRKGSKKMVSSTARKVSNASTASKASLRAAIPNDKEIDAALEAELDRPLTDEEGEMDPLETDQPKARRLTSSKPGVKATASVAPTRRGKRASTMTADDTSMADLYPSIPNVSDSEREAVPIKSTEAISPREATDHLSKTKNTKAKSSRKASAIQPTRKEEMANPEGSTDVDRKTLDQQRDNLRKPQQSRSRQTSRQIPSSNAEQSISAGAPDEADLTLDINGPVLDMQTFQDDSGHETDASVVKQGRAKRGSKRVPATSHKSKVGKKSATTNCNIEDLVLPVPQEIPSKDIHHQPDVIVAGDRPTNVEQVLEEIEPPKKQLKIVEAAAKPIKGKKTGPKPKSATRKASAASTVDEPMDLNEEQDGKVSPTSLSVHSTPRPALSPQSSDIENQPPSSRPSTQRPPLALQSLSKSQSMQVPLAPATPTASPSKGTFSKLQTTFPWTMVDLERIFQGTPASEKENSPFVFGNPKIGLQNALTSPEKKLSVEQWIQYNAQRGEEKLRNECERLVGRFESEGIRALRALEGIVYAE